MSPDVTIGLSIVLASAFTLAVAVLMRRNYEAQLLDVETRLSYAAGREARLTRRAMVAEAAVDALTGDLATERRQHIRTKTALLEAEADLIPLRIVAERAAEVVTAFSEVRGA